MVPALSAFAAPQRMTLVANTAARAPDFAFLQDWTSDFCAKPAETGFALSPTSARCLGQEQAKPLAQFSRSWIRPRPKHRVSA